MKPHMAYMNNTLIKKELAESAKNQKTSYRKYREQVDAVLAIGHTKDQVIEELEMEIERIMGDNRPSEDPIFQQGVHNAKVACISAIRMMSATWRAISPPKGVLLSGSPESFIASAMFQLKL